MNRYWQLPGELLVRWRMFVPPLVLLPITFFIPPPIDPIYWISTFISASMVLAHDSALYNVSARYGAQVAFRLRPLILPAVFIIWLFIKPKQFDTLVASPLLASGILACLSFATFFLMRLNKCVVTRAAFFEMIPVIITGIIFEITNKTAMDHAVFPSNTLYYVCTVSGAPLLFILARAGKNARVIVKEMSAIASRGVLLGFFVIFSMGTKNLAMMGAPNPAYVTAITLTAPFWISLYIRLRGEKEEADWVSGTGLVISIIMMTLLASILPH
jgi:hypothetical protein